MKKFIFAVFTATAIVAVSSVAHARGYSQNTQYSNSGLISYENSYPGWTYDSTEGWKVSPSFHFKGHVRQYTPHYDPSHVRHYEQHFRTHSSIVAYGHLLQSQGFRVSEHPAFGGVHHVHSHHSAHYSGKAIDINVGTGVVEASSAYAHRFDVLAARARAAGFKVLWRVAGHFNHIHIQY